ncbi:MAG: ABC transporter permease, partial [Dehalococcoidales bacterium]|nr:ABC transporter permease [Dehalococcoidales bacterium]
MNVFSKLFKNKWFWGGILVPIFFQLIYLCIAIPAINDGNNRINEFNVAVVNEDAVLGEEITANLFQSLPFNTCDSSDLSSSLDSMDDDDYNMVIYIPADFSPKFQLGEGQISYYINQ